MAAYSGHADVKVVLQIGDSDTTYDDEIDACITSGDALIDKLLAAHDLTVPASVPQTVEDASIYFAAWLFRRRRDPTGAEGIMTGRAHPSVLLLPSPCFDFFPKKRKSMG